MNTRIANFLSAVCHPLLMPTLLFGILLYFAPDVFMNLGNISESSGIEVFGFSLSVKNGLLLLIFNFTFLIPSYFIYLLHRFNVVKSLKMESLLDRRIPFLVTTILYTLGTTFFALKMSQLPEISIIMIGVTLALAAVTVVSLYWQISAHATGIGGVLGALMSVLATHETDFLLWPMLVILILAGYLMSARLYLNAHTPLQITAGLVLGFCLSAGVVVVFL